MPSSTIVPEAEQQSAGPPTIEATASPSFNSLFALQASVVVIAALYFARDVLIPITVAGLLSFLLGPLVSFLRRMRVNRIVSVVLAALLALGVLIVIGTVIGMQLAQLLSRLPEYVTTIQTKIGTIGSYATDHFSGVLQRLGLARGSDGGAAPATGQLPSTGASTLDADPAAPAQDAALSPMTVLTTYVAPVLSPFATAGIVFVVAIFILLQKEDLRDRMIRLFGSSDLHRTTGAMDDAAHPIG